MLRLFGWCRRALLRQCSPLAVSLLMFAGANPASAVFTETTFLPVSIDGRPYEIEVMIARPDAVGRYPVALVTHGTAPTGRTAHDMRPESGLGGWVRDFASRGYLAVAVMRRGYGLSDGEVASDAGKCATPAPKRYIDSNADDLEAVVRALAKRPDADTSRIVGIGQSMGGTTLLALAARKTVPMAAVFNISGGLFRYENMDGLIAYDAFDGCDKFKAAMIATMGRYGAKAVAPTFWYYAENDPWFRPAFVGEMQAAWTGAGGKAKLVMLPPTSINGHDIFYEARSRQLLLPEIDEALRSLGLPTWNAHDMSAMAGAMSPQQRPMFERYLRKEGAAKALAISPSDPATLFWSARQPTIGRAVENALSNCRARAHTDCRIVMKNFEPVDPASVMSAM